MEHNHHDHNHNHHKEGAISKLKAKAGNIEEWLLPIFGKAPHLPQSWRKLITTVAPWLALIFGILGLIGFLGSSYLGIILSPIIALKNGLNGIVIFLVMLLDFITLILAIIAFNPLSEMKKNGWDYVYYAFLTGAISSVLNLMVTSRGMGDVVVIVLGLYVLFEVRERYN